MLDLLCAILRDEPFTWPADDVSGARLFDVARQHGVHLVVADRVSRRGRIDDCPAPLRDRLVMAIRSQVAIDEVVGEELRRVFGALADAGITPLLFKGSALAYSHYPDPTLRPRVDTDVLIDSGEADRVRAILERLGYRRPPFVTGDLVMHQVPYVRTDSRGVQHAIDVHWKISNPQVFAGALAIDELRARATTIPALGHRAVGPAHALIVACVHRVAHHSDEERLIWLYDIHLLAERLAPVEQDEFLLLVHAKQLNAVCAAGLARAHEKFHGPAVAALLARLDAPTARPERSEIYVRGPMRKVDVLMSDLEALEGWRPKMKLLREHVLPPASYMREAYGVSNPALLPFLYVWRFIRGATQWFTLRGIEERGPGSMAEPASGTPLRPSRVALSVPALYRSVGEERWHHARTENISRVGVLLRGARLFSQSTKVEVVMTLPAGIVPDLTGALFFTGTVARLLPPPWSGGVPGLAIAFVMLRPAETADTARM